MEELETYVEVSLNNALELGMTKAQIKETLDNGISPEKTPDLWNVMVKGYNSWFQDTPEYTDISFRDFLFKVGELCNK